MINIEEIYKEHTVKIIYNEFIGSGCIYQFTQNDICYVFTAKHCFTDVDDEVFNIDKEKIKIQRGEPFNDEVYVNDVFFHKKLDIAILTMRPLSNKVSTIKVSSIDAQKDSKVCIYGFPSKIKDKLEPRENVNCTISFRHDDHYELASDNVQFTFNTSVPENIKGLSGSGVYYEENGNLSLVGIFTKLKGVDGVYNKFTAIKFREIEEFIVEQKLKWISITNIDNISKDPFLYKKVFYLPYSIESEPYYLCRPFDHSFLGYLNSPKNIWLSGLSGVGKTNCIFRNLFINKKEFAFIDLSTIQNKEIDEYFEYINQEIIDQKTINEFSKKENVIEKIIENLCLINTQKNQIIVFVDEVPIYDKNKFNSFVSNFITISDRFVNLATGKQIKWIISTRTDPSNHLRQVEDCFSNQQKAQRHFLFHTILNWNDTELGSLLEILQQSLNFTLDTELTYKAIAAANGFPGKLKDIIERVVLDEIDFEKAIELIKMESPK